MGETIRDRLKKRYRLIVFGGLAILAGWWLLLNYVIRPVGWGMPRYTQLPPHDELVLSGWLLLGFTTGGVWAYTLSRIRCPKCGTVFGYTFVLRAASPLPGGRGARSPVDACPKCGVSLDSSWS
jgi:hypothetical protein